jgi:hypothetical protein
MSSTVAGPAGPNLEECSVPAQNVMLDTAAGAAGSRHQEPPDVAWLLPELDDGADDGLLRPPGFELLDLPEFDAPEPELPEPEEPEEPPAEEEPGEDAALLCVEPGRVSVTVPAATRLAKPIAAVVVWILLRPRSRAATARATVSRFVFLMTRSLGPCSLLLLGAASQPPMSRGSRRAACRPAPAHHGTEPAGCRAHPH